MSESERERERLELQGNRMSCGSKVHRLIDCIEDITEWMSDSKNDDKVELIAMVQSQR